ncbi:MAG: iron-containing alcohol dehydrogenase, partial [Erysipelotrichaceae bacterium]|nr:iron-containing alcohol dehydrogenase [Erysipelotrichaceae bacterium]
MANSFLTPRMIISGSDSLSAAASELQKLGQKAFIVTDETMVKLGNVALLEDVLKKNGTSYFIFPKVNYEPDDLIVKEGAAVYQENHCDHLIALGGGSPIDTAKAIAILLNDDAPLSS